MSPDCSSQKPFLYFVRYDLDANSSAFEARLKPNRFNCEKPDMRCKNCDIKVENDRRCCDCPLVIIDDIYQAVVARNSARQIISLLKERGREEIGPEKTFTAEPPLVSL